MRRSITVALVVGLLVGAFAIPAEAQRKKKKQPKPVDTVLYMDGESRFGEEESFTLVADGFLKLVPDEPGGSDSKSKQIINYGAGPNPKCAGNRLVPVFVGNLSGTVKGDITATFHTMASGGSVELRIWPDVADQMCNDAYPEPAAVATVALPSGQGEVEAVFEDVNFTASRVVMLQVTPVLTPPYFGRMYYGSTAAPSKLEFKCIPASGKTCT
jgi:hypothetical protein